MPVQGHGRKVLRNTAKIRIVREGSVKVIFLLLIVFKFQYIHMYKDSVTMCIFGNDFFKLIELYHIIIGYCKNNIHDLTYNTLIDRNKKNRIRTSS